MKAAVSIPDLVFKRADALAKRRRQSRSRLYTEALREYLQRHELDALTEAMRLAHFGEQPDPSVDADADDMFRDIEWKE